ncbi:hypothetical protein [Halalkalicoccus salilacus]|uniref:hypothetical protein n=1 Tax=Halalkalicoccus sp. GCM10025704 TaxID=3252662 RepID=UPI00360DDBAB
MTSMLNYYRSLFRGNLRSLLPGESRPDETTTDGVISQPTLLIWGMRDRALSPRLTEGSNSGFLTSGSNGYPRRATGCSPTSPAG